MLKNEDIISCNVILTSEERDNIVNIAKSTHNTWQTNRTLESKISDTTIGKMCEKAILDYMRSKKLHIVDYDDHRKDGYRNHAPVDFIICQNKSSARKVADLISKKSVERDSFRFSVEERRFLVKEKAFLCEIKSTRITDRHRRNGCVDTNKIISQDDFLSYPLHIRKSSTINSLDDYVEYCFINNKARNKEELMKKEKSNMLNLYFRAYIDMDNDNVFIIGGIDRKNFITKSYIKKMPQKNKSEKAIYIATKLSNGISIDRTTRLIKNFYKEYKRYDLSNS